MIDQHLGRRSVSDFQRGVLALRKQEIVAERRARAAPAPATARRHRPTMARPSTSTSHLPPAPPMNSREAVPKAARLSSSQVVMIEKIQKQAAPELVEAVKAGTISLNAAAAVSSLPTEEQQADHRRQGRAQAGGQADARRQAQAARTLGR